MAGEAEKKRRSIALGGFTRSVNLLNTVINEKSPISVVTPKYDRVNEAWYKLEAAHDAFIEQTDIDIEEHADGIKYLDKHTETFKKVVSDYSVYFKSAEAESIKQKGDADKLVERERVETESRLRVEAEAKSKNEEMGTKFESTKAEFISMLDDFKRLSLASKDSLKDASDDDKLLRRRCSNN